MNDTISVRTVDLKAWTTEHEPRSVAMVWVHGLDHSVTKLRTYHNVSQHSCLRLAMLAAYYGKIQPIQTTQVGWTARFVGRVEGADG